MNPWQPITLNENDAAHWTLGALDLWVRFTAAEWQAAVKRGEERNHADCERTTDYPEDLDWRRWTGGAAGDAIQALPALPDRPVVVRPASPLSILPDEESRFFIGISLWISLQLKSGNDRNTVLLEEPAQLLSNTWFGLPTDGELCYALPTRARLRLDDVEQSPCRAVCPLRVRNETAKPLEIQRLCLRTANLGLYRGRNHIWTGACDVTHREQEEQIDTHYPAGAPPFDDAGELIGPPRETVRRKLSQRIFGGRNKAKG